VAGRGKFGLLNIWRPIKDEELDGILIKRIIRIHLKSHRKIIQKRNQKMLQKIPHNTPPTTEINQFYEFYDPEPILR
jgi:hypothetical protein